MEIGGIYYKIKIMKHILNNLSEEEKNAIREQHSGGMKIELGKFKQMVETKLGDPKPYLNEDLDMSNKNKFMGITSADIIDCAKTHNVDLVDAVSFYLDTRLMQNAVKACKSTVENKNDKTAVECAFLVSQLPFNSNTNVFKKYPKFGDMLKCLQSKIISGYQKTGDDYMKKLGI